MLSYIKSLPERAPWRYFKKYPLLGLDLGFNEIRLLQLEKRAGTFHIEKILAYPLPLENSQDEKKISWEEVQEQLGDLVRQTELAGCSVALALPCSAIIKKQIELPLHFNEEELASELEQRICQYFPGIPENEIHFDFTLSSSTEDKHQILLVATRKEVLQSQVKVVTKAGFRAGIVDVDLYALARAGGLFFYRDQESKTQAAALLDLRWPVFTFIAFYEEDLIFHHQWRVDRESFEAPLAHRSTLIQQMRNVWQLCKATHPKLKIEFFGIAGELAGLDELALLLQKEFSPPAQVINPFQGMTHSSFLKIETVNNFSSRFLLGCGLAMRGSVLW